MAILLYFLTHTYAFYHQEGSSRAAYSTGDVVVEGDMLMTPRQYLSSYGLKTSFTAMIKDEQQLWPHAVVPWSMTDNFAKDKVDFFTYRQMGWAGQY